MNRNDMEEKYDVLILTTAKDFERVECCYPHLLQEMQPRKVVFIGSSEVGELCEKFNDRNPDQRVGFLNEEAVIPFSLVHEAMKKALGVQELARRTTGWYYQQFLKMQYSYLCKDNYYLVWDGDTIPCRTVTMFQKEENIPYLDLKREYHKEYFETIEKILPGMHKTIEKSFIAEHMLFRCDIMKHMIADIMANNSLQGEFFWEKIIAAIPKDKLVSNSFSEFETYGTYVSYKYTTSYALRQWHSFRYAGAFLHPEKLTDADYQWFGKDFDALSFEKNQSVREDHENLFNNPKYQQRLSARKMLEIAQQEFTEGYLEVWDD